MSMRFKLLSGEIMIIVIFCSSIDMVSSSSLRSIFSRRIFFAFSHRSAGDNSSALIADAPKHIQRCSSVSSTPFQEHLVNSIMWYFKMLGNIICLSFYILVDPGVALSFQLLHHLPR